MVRRTVIALLACLTVATVALWVWSYVGSYPRLGKGRIAIPDAQPHQGWRWDVSRGYTPSSVGARTGCLFVSYNQEVQRMERISPPKQTDIDLGAVHLHIQQHAQVKSGYFTIDFWLLTALLGAYPTIALIRGPIRRARRRANNLCLHCGYDLTGSVGDTCSECGQKFSLSK